MKKFLLISTFLLFISITGHAQNKKAPYRLVFSPHLTPWTGAEDINTLQRGLMEGEHFLLNSVPGYFTDDSLEYSTIRAAELALIWTPISYLEMVYQHEYFGHGGRIRLFNKENIVSVEGYSYNTPPPYGKGGAITRFFVNEPLISNYLLAAISAGGVNATGILGMSLQEKWFESESIDGRDSLLYLRAYQNLTDYVFDVRFTSTEKKTKHSGHDMEDYLLYLKNIYNKNFTVKKLRNYSLANLVDPYTYYALWSVVNYVLEGSPISPWTIPIGKYQYLPSFRLMLAPYGPEVLMTNYIKTPSSKWMSLSLRSGNGFVPANSYGAGFHMPKVFTKDRLSVGGKIDLWNQPKISLLKTSNFNPNQKKWGGALQIESSYQLYGITSLFGQVGYKTKGYLPGEAISNRFLIQLGFEIEL